MSIKKIICEILKKGAQTTCTASKASMGTWGVEKMPQSMKNKR